ncbi:uncharacterized protein EAE97_010618 [Botrytis byssoidea]|uniref:ATPase AAA-type core domain-containing protein n=1 Tax=Botrytis byssoidea TaxID=139641 RepID=A0A9P5LUJ7_9HELO|nr:uncharacterized protein EAE97_010618 [Botrytis byssoidea]KAF7924667.1 hypothetical protein EAE97_010618 [Botrytis byssoidea]
MDSEIAQVSRSLRLSKLVKLSRGSKKKGLTNISGQHRLGGSTNPENDKSETDDEGKNDDDNDEYVDEDDYEDEDEDEGEGTRPDKNEDQSTTAGRANKYRKPEFSRDSVNNPLNLHSGDRSGTLAPEQSKLEPRSANPLAPPQNFGKTRITISDNLSTDDNKKNRRLLALKPKLPKPASTSNLDISDNQLGGYNPGETGPEGPGGLNRPLHRSQPEQVAAFNREQSLRFQNQQMFQHQMALQNQQQMAMNRRQASHPMHSTFSHIQNEPLSPQLDSVVDLFSALGIDAIAMGIPSESLNNVQAFREYLLQTMQAKEPNRYLILHLIKGQQERMYFDPPEWVMGHNDTRILRSRLPLFNLRDFLEKNTDISFIVFRDYKEKDIPTRKGMVAPAATNNNSGITKSPVHEEEKILAVSEHLTEAIKSILKSKPEYADLLVWFEKGGTELPSPFVFIYHSRAVIGDSIEDTSDPSTVRQLKLMIDYIYKNYGEEYDTADAMFEESRVAIPYVKYLFKPGDVLVKGTGSDINGYMFVTWLHDSTSITASLKEDGKNKPSSQYTMDVRSWSFDGAFNRVSTRLTLEIDGSEKTEYAIKDLNIRSIAYASDEDRKILQSRGEMFWKCRERKFVSHQEQGRGDLHGASEERYMIDMKTFRELHPEEEKKNQAAQPEDEKKKASDTLDEDAMAQDSPPYPIFVYLLPQKIIGYNMRRKKWVELHADWLSEVVWDKKAFKKLVLAQKTKDLIEALIVNQIAAEKSTDLISGKGNGLILLLHGGPGTGKTLTAESVAEIAEKPLYRVTCGDIGSEPEEVEQYLNSVLDLVKSGTASFCSMKPTSSLRKERCDIWTMFITRLRELGETQVDFADLEDHRWDLADYKLNGRQIRNAIQTSRQFVSWKNAKEKTTLNFEILKQIIEISGEFDVYINKLNNGMSPDQLAEEDGLRLAEARE